MNTSLVRPKSDTFAMFSSEIKTFRAAKSLKKTRLDVVILYFQYKLWRKGVFQKERGRKGEGGGETKSLKSITYVQISLTLNKPWLCRCVERNPRDSVLR